MVDFRCCGTGSSGNAYAITCQEETLLLDAGMPIKSIKEMLDWNIKKVVGCVVSHKHFDHSRSIKEIEKCCIPVFKPYEELEMISADARVMVAEKLGGFKITAFQVPHDGTRNCGFLISHEDETILYITDFEYCPYNFAKRKIDHMILECNYIQNLVNVEDSKNIHKIKGHAELLTVKNFIQSSKTKFLSTVILCHLGKESTDEERILAEIKEVSGCDTYIAHPGMKLEIRGKYECPF